MCAVYGEGEMTRLDRFYIYSLVVINLSQCWALYCLLIFYKELKDELAPINPLGKFMVVKVRHQ